MKNIGINMDVFYQYIDEQILILPGIRENKDTISIALTGSRATNTYTDQSDIDIEILSDHATINDIQLSMFQEGLFKNRIQNFYHLTKSNYKKYFGLEIGEPHLSLISYEKVDAKLKDHDDVHKWIWSNSLIIRDHSNKIYNIIKNCDFYPNEILIKKLKYRYLSSLYWIIDVYPHHKKTDKFTAMLSIINGINEFYKLFYLLDSKPYPYIEKIPMFVTKTTLGSKYYKPLNDITEQLLNDSITWSCLDKMLVSLLYTEEHELANQLDKDINQAMLQARVEKVWMELGYDNIDELLYGHLGPVMW